MTAGTVIFHRRPPIRSRGIAHRLANNTHREISTGQKKEHGEFLMELTVLPILPPNTGNRLKGTLCWKKDKDQSCYIKLEYQFYLYKKKKITRRKRFNVSNKKRFIVKLENIQLHFIFHLLKRIKYQRTFLPTNYYKISIILPLISQQF